jgi:cysteine-rich repeat protein
VGSVRLGLFGLVVGSLVVAGACSTYTPDQTDNNGGSDPGGGSEGAGKAGSSAKGGSTGPDINLGGNGNEGGCDLNTDATCGLPPEELGFCSDGNQDPGEACDDGNAVSGDGCTATCVQVEGDYVCPTPGEPCVST